MSEKKKSTICHIKCCGFFISRESRLLLAALDAAISSAYDGVLQPKIAGAQNAFPCLQPEGGSVKKIETLTLSLNCAETVRRSEIMLETKNMRPSISYATVKT